MRCSVLRHRRHACANGGWLGVLSSEAICACIVKELFNLKLNPLAIYIVKLQKIFDKSNYCNENDKSVEN